MSVFEKGKVYRKQGLLIQVQHLVTEANTNSWGQPVGTPWVQEVKSGETRYLSKVADVWEGWEEVDPKDGLRPLFLREDGHWYYEDETADYVGPYETPHKAWLGYQTNIAFLNLPKECDLSRLIQMLRRANIPHEVEPQDGYGRKGALMLKLMVSGETYSIPKSNLGPAGRLDGDKKYGTPEEEVPTDGQYQSLIGYGGFVTHFYFTPDGVLLRVGIWE